jgi:hypothetical protein
MKTNFLHFKSVGSQTFTTTLLVPKHSLLMVLIFGTLQFTNKNQVTVTVIDDTDGSSNDIAQAGLSL